MSIFSQCDTKDLRVLLGTEGRVYILRVQSGRDFPLSSPEGEVIRREFSLIVPEPVCKPAPRCAIAIVEARGDMDGDVEAVDRFKGEKGAPTRLISRRL